jgi:AcrR family transcriptional regulator
MTERRVQARPVRYTNEMPGSQGVDDQRSSLRAEHVAQTRAALVAAGRRLFGRAGFAATSVEDLAREAGVTTGALYHHFPTKAALFEAVFELVHLELMQASGEAAAGADAPMELLALGFEAFLDQVLEPDVQRIVITDAPSVLGPARFTELDERYAFAAIVAALDAAAQSGALRADDPQTLATLLLGMLTRGGMLIASSAEPVATRNAVAATLRSILAGLAGG